MAVRTAPATLIDLLLEKASVGLCLVAPSGAVVRANAEWLRSTGFTEEQVVGEDIADLFPGTRDAVLAAHARARAGHRVELPRHAQVIDGRETWWEGSVEAVSMEGGTGLLVTAREVTPASTAHDALRESEERYRTLFTKMLEGFAVGEVICDDDGKPVDFRFLEMNDAFERQSGLRRDVARGRPMREVLPHIERSWAETYGGVALGGPEVRFENYNKDLDRHFSVYCFSPAPGRFAILFYDVTERKRAEDAIRESESRLRRLYDSGMIGVLHFDLDGAVFDANDRFLEMVGYSRAELEAGQIAWDRMTPPAYRAADALAVAELEARGVDTPYEKEYIRKDGSRVSILIGAATYGEARQRGIAFVLDITDQKRAEGALREANERLQEEHRRKDEFLGMLSHELRNPLAPIRNSTYVLQHAAAGSDQARRAQSVIQRQTEHLTRLVDDLLDVTRVARGKIELRRSRVDLRDVVLRAADDFRLLFHDRGVSFELAVPSEQLWADADPTRVTQIVGNLLHNASKFTRRGDAVTLSMRQAGDGVAEIRVGDTGAGIEPELLPLIFDAFVQGKRTLARTEGGLGLGLALVKGIVELHGGSVRADSAGKGQGAEFTVRLPLREALQRDALERPSGTRQGGGRRVLVVDDNADAAESLADVVRMLGHSVEVVFDGPSAIEAAKATRPDVVLCDIGLPGMDGYEVVKALRAAALDGMQIVAVSGYAQPEDVQKAVEAGFDGHIAKPCDPEEIARLLG